jgi:hypothetical protein
MLLNKLTDIVQIVPEVCQKFEQTAKLTELPHDDPGNWHVNIFTNQHQSSRNQYDKIAKSDCYLRHASLSVTPQGITPLTLDGFSRNLILDNFSKISQENSSFIKF